MYDCKYVLQKNRNIYIFNLLPLTRPLFVLERIDYYSCRVQNPRV